MNLEIENHIASTPANLEQADGYESLGAKKTTRFDAPVCVHVHSIRRRLADSDGVSAKAAIDGIVKAGILADDTAKHVKNVSYSQEKTKGEEKTIIELIDTADVEKVKLHFHQEMEKVFLG